MAEQGVAYVEFSVRMSLTPRIASHAQLEAMLDRLKALADEMNPGIASDDNAVALVESAGAPVDGWSERLGYPAESD